MFKKYKSSIYTLVFIFAILFIVYFNLFENYIHISETNYTKAIKNNIQALIKTKETDVFLISKSLAKEKRLIKVMKDGDFGKLYSKNFFRIPKEYFMYNRIHVHVVDKDGIQRYLSWTKKDIGNSALDVRRDLRKIFLNPHPKKEISVGKFDITFKGIMPIYDKNHNFLGIIETIASFRKIEQNLQKRDIQSVVVIDKSYSKGLKYPKSKIFISGYNISKYSSSKILDFIREEGIDNFINIENYKYIPSKHSFVEGYYVISIPIKSASGNILGYYIAFIKDKFHLAKRETELHVILIILAILFLFMLLLAQKEHSKNSELIINLDKEVRRQIEEKLKLIYLDLSTGAYKKIKFDEDLSKQTGSKVVLFNIKNFSKINDTYGFETGDKILKICVKRVENLLKRKIYHLDADEFLFFTTNPKKDIRAIKEKFLLEAIKIKKDSVNLRITFSFAVAKSDTDKLISKLSNTVREAKLYPFSEFMYYRDKKRDDSFIKFNSILYDAIFSNKKDTYIIPYFQGIRDNELKKIIKFESLVRLKQADEIYSPYYFLDIAKSSGFIHEITKIMIEKSCERLSWTDESISVSINITEDDLATRQLKDFLINTIKKYNISPNRIVLEVLEGVTVSGVKNNIKQLSKLKQLGFRLAIDDFGVEYSNFERLSELDIDYIKIDGKYIKTLHTNPKSYKITKAITDFAHSLDIQVVAEFVENKEIQEVVEELGIECSQGYYFSKPQENMSI